MAQEQKNCACCKDRRKVAELVCRAQQYRLSYKLSDPPCRAWALASLFGYNIDDSSSWDAQKVRHNYRKEMRRVHSDKTGGHSGGWDIAINSVWDPEIKSVAASGGKDDQSGSVVQRFRSILFPPPPPQLDLFAMLANAMRQQQQPPVVNLDDKIGVVLLGGLPSSFASIFDFARGFLTARNRSNEWTGRLEPKLQQWRKQLDSFVCPQHYQHSVIEILGAVALELAIIECQPLFRTQSASSNDKNNISSSNAGSASAGVGAPPAAATAGLKHDNKCNHIAAECERATIAHVRAASLVCFSPLDYCALGGATRDAMRALADGKSYVFHRNAEWDEPKAKRLLQDCSCPAAVSSNSEIRTYCRAQIQQTIEHLKTIQDEEHKKSAASASPLATTNHNNSNR
jgi:hypothetical protein